MSAPTPKLTITFPLYGQHDMVDRAFTSLSKQTVGDFKIVCLDDKSPESFEKLAKKFKDNLDITIKYNPQNLGAMKNIWQSIQMETDTPYIMSHHADDFLKANYIEQAIDILDQNPDISFVLTGPVWVPANYPYTFATLDNVVPEIFDAADFALNILNFAPYIFGSVVYRRSHLIKDWKIKTMDTYADRYFLGQILKTNNSQGAYIHGQGIFERDHSKDTKDDRSPSLNEDHAIALLSFYKILLLLKYHPSKVETIITNTLLYYYSNFNKRSNLIGFYKKQRPYNLIRFSHIRLLGIYSLLVLPLNERQKRKAIQTIKRIRRLIKLS